MPVIAVTSMKGGVGKTTITLGLASAARQRGDRVLVVDLDPQGNATVGLGVDTPPPETALSDARPGSAARLVGPTPWGPTVEVIGADASLERENVSTGSPDRLRIALGALPSRYDTVIIDCPPSLGELTRNALAAATGVIVVTEPSYFALRGAQQAVDAAVATGCTQISIVLNRVRLTVADHRLRIAELRDFYGPQVLRTMIPERNAMAQAEGAGVAIHDWDSPAGHELSAAFDRLYAVVVRREAEDPWR